MKRSSTGTSSSPRPSRSRSASDSGIGPGNQAPMFALTSPGARMAIPPRFAPSTDHIRTSTAIPAATGFLRNPGSSSRNSRELSLVGRNSREWWTPAEEEQTWRCSSELGTSAIPRRRHHIAVDAENRRRCSGHSIGSFRPCGDKTDTWAVTVTQARSQGRSWSAWRASRWNPCRLSQ
jgi:hypothetical protein